MSESSVDRNLLFGILALQNNFVSRDALLSAFAVWVADKGLGLGKILMEHGKLSQPLYELLCALVEQHIQLHDNDPGQSLAVLSSAESLRDDLRKLGDSRLEASLGTISKRSPTDGESSTISALDQSSGSQRFRILRPLARGGLGEVYVAQDIELHREVALKEIQSRFVHDSNSRLRFVQEAEITGRLEHPGIVPVYGLGQYADGRPFYAMRFIHGDNLGRAIEVFHKADATVRDSGERSIELRQLLGRFIDVCHAIEYAHSRGILHRDLKPGNIMIGKYGETLVVDWGLAKSIGRSDSNQEMSEVTLRPTSAKKMDETALGSTIGTPAYMSPEQAAGRVEELGPASDVYSLGATLYCVLTGRAPVLGNDRGEVLTKVQRGDFPRPREVKPEVPAALQAVCLKAMNTDPHQRYASARNMAQDLELWLADEPLSAHPDPISVRIGRVIRKHKAAFAVALASGILGLVSLSVFAAVLSGKNSALASANKLAEENRKKAERHAETARSTSLNVVEIAENHLSKMQGLTGFRESVMDRVYTLYADTHRDSPEDEDVAWQLATLARMTGNVKRNLRKLQESHELLSQSLSLQNRLARKDKVSRNYLAETLRDQGTLLKVSGKLTLASSSLDQAGVILSELSKESPYDADLKATAATVDLERVGLHLDLSNDSAALQAAVSSERVLLELIDKSLHQDNDYTSALFATSRHGQILTKLGRTTEAQDVYDNGVKRGREWLEASTSPNLRRAFGRLLLYQATDLCEQDPLPIKADELVVEAITRFTVLVNASPDASIRSYLAATYRSQAMIEQKKGNRENAIRAFEQSVSMLEKLVSESPTPDNYIQLAKSQFQFGGFCQLNKEPRRAVELFEAAVRNQRQAVALKPESTADRQLLDSYQQALDSVK